MKKTATKSKKVAERKLQYPAKIVYSSEDKRFFVEFPDLEGCISEGSTLEEALRNAKEALAGYLASVLNRGLVIPKPSKPKSSNIYMIKPKHGTKKCAKLSLLGGTEKKLRAIPRRKASVGERVDAMAESGLLKWNKKKLKPIKPAGHVKKGDRATVLIKERR